MNKPFPITRGAFAAILFLVRLCAIPWSLALLYIPLTRDRYVDISANLYGPDAPLMDSPLLDTLLRPWLSVLLIIAMVAYIFYRTRFLPRRMRKAADLLYCVAAVLTLYLLLAPLYSPISKSFT